MERSRFFTDALVDAPSPYELKRAANIAANDAKLAELGLEGSSRQVMHMTTPLQHLP